MALSYVAKGLREMKIEARNGFRKIPHKKRVIKDRKKEIDCIIREYGSFLPDELENILKKTYRIVDRIYKPNMKRSRKK